MSEEAQKVTRFEEAVRGLVLQKVRANITQVRKSDFKIVLAEPFGGPWFLAHAHRIPALVQTVMDKLHLEHFCTCVEGMAQSSREKKETLTTAKVNQELATTFSADLMQKHGARIQQIIARYLRLVDSSGVSTARINTQQQFDLPLAIPSFQGLHPICTTHAVAFCISSQLRRMYGQAFSVGRDKILHVMQSMCKSWTGISTIELVRKMQANICDDPDVWFSNDWGDRRLRISVRTWITNHDDMLAEMERGISIPCAIKSGNHNHLVCAVKLMQGGGENENKVLALNSWGHLKPVVVICKDEPQFLDEFQFVQAFNMHVNVVAVRGENGRVIACPHPRC